MKAFNANATWIVPAVAAVISVYIDIANPYIRRSTLSKRDVTDNRIAAGNGKALRIGLGPAQEGKLKVM